MEREILTLKELQSGIRQTLEEGFPDRVWLRAEISALNARKNGHCYMDLVQSEDGTAVAKARAVAWRNVWAQLSRSFRMVTGADLAEGMSVLLQVVVNYSEVYGLSLVVNDIDAEYTLGDSERKRQETIARLVSEGLMDRQKALEIPALPYRIAVVSAPDAAGYRDFCQHLENNEYGFVFSVELYQALMQGESSASSVAQALSDIEASGVPYDCVMIMRGGGGKLDMACFDEYEMAAAIARCPLPVITGIGHDQDFHVADMVACHYVKTPTALADWLIEIYASEDESLAYYGTRLKLAFLNKVAAMEAAVNLLESKIKGADPRLILSRGYVLAVDAAGRVLRSAAGVASGDELGIMFQDGTVKVIAK